MSTFSDFVQMIKVCDSTYDFLLIMDEIANSNLSTNEKIMCYKLLKLIAERPGYNVNLSSFLTSLSYVDSMRCIASYTKN